MGIAPNMAIISALIPSHPVVGRVALRVLHKLKWLCPEARTLICCIESGVLTAYCICSDFRKHEGAHVRPIIDTNLVQSALGSLTSD